MKGNRTATQKAARQWTNTQSMGRETASVLGNLWYFHLCGCNTVAVQYLSWTWAACTWVQKKWRFVLGIDLHIRPLLSLAGRLHYTRTHQTAPRMGNLVALGCCLTEEHASRWDPPQGRSPAQCFGHFAPQWPGVSLALLLTGSAFISWSGKHLRLKICFKTKVRTASSASYLGILLFYTMDQEFSLSWTKLNFSVENK